LIPLITATARLFDSEHKDDETMMNKAITHADDLNAWLYGVKAGSIKETRYQINPDNSEINSFCKERYAQCIKGVAGASVSFDNNSVISRLTNAISTQNEEAIKSNRLRRQKIEHIINKDESKKDRTKKNHTSIIKMIRQASAKSSTDESEALLVMCAHFINLENVGMAQYELIHQFKELGFPDIGFAQGMVQALYIGDFLYSDSGTPSNFTVFALHEVEPLSNSRQKDYLVCQLVQTQGQKKMLDKIIASLKQTVHIPSDFNGMGTQLQVFAAACEIFLAKRAFVQPVSGSSLSLSDATRKLFETTSLWTNFSLQNSFSPPTINSNTGSACANLQQSLVHKLTTESFTSTRSLMTSSTANLEQSYLQLSRK
jgi:hypothetical protein